MRQRLTHVNPDENVSNRYALAIGETDEHWLAVIVYTAQGAPGNILYALLKSEYVVAPEKKSKPKPKEDDGSDLI